MTSICLTLEFLKSKIVKSKKQATKKPQSYYHKKHTTFTKKKTTSHLQFQFTVSNMMTKSKQYFTKKQTISYFPLLRLRKDYSVGKSKLHLT